MWQGGCGVGCGLLKLVLPCVAVVEDELACSCWPGVLVLEKHTTLIGCWDPVRPVGKKIVIAGPSASKHETKTIQNKSDS